MYAVIRVRGSVNVAREVADTLKMLRLTRVNHCVVIPKNPNYEGMLSKVKAFITWGEITQDLIEKLVAKRGRLPGDQRVPEKEAKEIAKKILKEESLKDSGIKHLLNSKYDKFIHDIEKENIESTTGSLSLSNPSLTRPLW